jgi:hypothetical protein
LKLLGGLLVGVFRSHTAREAEMAFLRQQLVALKRSAPARLRLRTADRLIFVWLYRLFPSLLEAAVVFKPETLVRWYRRGFRLWNAAAERRLADRYSVADVPDVSEHGLHSEIYAAARRQSGRRLHWRPPRQ